MLQGKVAVQTHLDSSTTLSSVLDTASIQIVLRQPRAMQDSDVECVCLKSMLCSQANNKLMLNMNTFFNIFFKQLTLILLHDLMYMCH